MPEIAQTDAASPATEQAEERTRETRGFMQSVRRATRRKYTPEEKIRIVLEGFRREATVSDLCRREGIKPANYYSWTKELMEAGKERLTRNTVRDATRQEIEQLKRENGDLKEIVADLVIETHRLKKKTPSRSSTTAEAADERHQESCGNGEGPSVPGAGPTSTTSAWCFKEHLLPVAYPDNTTPVPTCPMEPPHGRRTAKGTNRRKNLACMVESPGCKVDH